MTDPHIVAVVVDPDFGDRISELAERMPVWIVDTPMNRAASEKHWASGPQLQVTTFPIDSRLTAETWLVNVLSAIDLHHGEYSRDPPYSAVEVFGASLTPAIKTTLGQFGLVNFAERPGGFIATKLAAA
jgi:hypothetical protein